MGDSIANPYVSLESMKSCLFEVLGADGSRRFFTNFECALHSANYLPGSWIYKSGVLLWHDGVDYR